MWSHLLRSPVILARRYTSQRAREVATEKLWTNTKHIMPPITTSTTDVCASPHFQVSAPHPLQGHCHHSLIHHVSTHGQGETSCVRFVESRGTRKLYVPMVFQHQAYRAVELACCGATGARRYQLPVHRRISSYRSLSAERAQLT